MRVSERSLIKQQSDIIYTDLFIFVLNNITASGNKLRAHACVFSFSKFILADQRPDEPRSRDTPCTTWLHQGNELYR